MGQFVDMYAAAHVTTPKQYTLVVLNLLVACCSVDRQYYPKSQFFPLVAFSFFPFPLSFYSFILLFVSSPPLFFSENQKQTCLVGSCSWLRDFASFLWLRQLQARAERAQFPKHRHFSLNKKNRPPQCTPPTAHRRPPPAAAAVTRARTPVRRNYLV